MEAIGTLPEEWQEKWDPGTGRHYYWCTRTDKVSWLPPGHPKAKITEAASHVREMIQNQIHMEPDQDEDLDDSEEDEEEDEHAMDLDSDMVLNTKIHWDRIFTRSLFYKQRLLSNDFETSQFLKKNSEK